MHPIPTSSGSQFAEEHDASLVSASKVAEQLHLQPEALAQILRIEDGPRSEFRAADVQEVLRSVARVFTTAAEVFRDDSIASKWMTEPVRAFRGKTALTLVANGHAEHVVSYLHSIESGFVG